MVDQINASALFISNTTGSRDVVFTGATLMQSSPTQLKLKITEDQRLEATFMSGTKSGDGIPATFMNDFAAFLDVGLNPVSPGSNITLVEVPDTVPPFLVLVTLDLSHGIIYLTGSETIKTVGNAKLRAPGYLIGYDPDDSNIKLNLTTAAILNRSDHSSDLEKVSLEGASFMAELSLVVTVQLTEAKGWQYGFRERMEAMAIVHFAVAKRSIERP